MFTDFPTSDLLGDCNILYENTKVDKKIGGFTCQSISLEKENKEMPREFRNVSYQVGPFSISYQVEEDDRKLIQYVFDSNLDQRSISYNSMIYHY